MVSAERSDPPRRFVVDVDAHGYENPRGFAQYLGEPWRTRITHWTSPYFTLPAKSLMADGNVGGRIHHQRLAGRDADPRDEILAVMRRFGIDVSMMLPGSMLRIGELADPGLAVALCSGFADHMLQDVVDPERGIYTMLVAPNQDPKAAAQLIDRVGDHPGAVGVLLMTYGSALGLGDPYYDPVFDACCRHDLPLVFHSFDHAGEARLLTMLEGHLGFVINAQVQLTHMILHGLPERFPKLRIVFEEAGVFWIPEMMFRLDTAYSIRRSQAPLLKKPPSEYIKECYFTTQPLERVPDADYLRAIFRMCDGPRCLMYASDWPHADFDSPVVIDRLSFLSPHERQAILGDNACRAFTRVRRSERAAPATGSNGQAGSAPGGTAPPGNGRAAGRIDR
jgi:predicted TIM-barrel fold metal-dependent hydrolase